MPKPCLPYLVIFVELREILLLNQFHGPFVAEADAVIEIPQPYHGVWGGLAADTWPMAIRYSPWSSMPLFLWKRRPW